MKSAARFAWFLLLVPACGGNSGGAGLHAEVMPFGGLAFDSGSVPSGSPVTFDFKASASGVVDLDASSGSPAKGTLKMDGKVVLLGTAKSTITGATYDGPIEGAPDLSTALAGSAALDLTTIGTPSTLSVTVPASDLATIPLATALGIPAVTGNLDLKVVGGTVTSVYAPTCAESGSYAGTVTTSGSVMVGGDVVVAVPIVGSMTVPIPAFSIPLPNQVDAVTLGKSGCGAPPTGDGGNVDAATASDGSADVLDGAMPPGDMSSNTVAIDPAASYNIAIRVIDETTASGLGPTVCTGEDNPDPFVTLSGVDAMGDAVSGGSGRCNSVKVCDLSHDDGLVRVNQNGGLANTNNAPVSFSGLDITSGNVGISVGDFDEASNDIVGQGYLPATSNAGSGVLLMAGPYNASGCTQAMIPVTYEITPAP